MSGLLACGLGLILSGCSTTTQMTPKPATDTPSPRQVRISINGNRNIYPPLKIKDGASEIGQLGRTGSLTWDRPEGRCNLEARYTDSTMTGQKEGRAGVFSGNLAGGREYSFEIGRKDGVFYFQPSAESKTGIVPIEVPVCILPVVNATGGKGISLDKYAEAYNLPKAKSGSYFPANWAFRDLSQWGYTKPFYGGEQTDAPAIYAAAKQGAVPKQLLPAEGNPSYCLLVAVHRFDDVFRIMWLADSTVECCLIRTADGKVVYRTTKEGSGRGGALNVDSRILIRAYKVPELAEGDAWQQAIWEATHNAVEEMPILEP